MQRQVGGGRRAVVVGWDVELPISGLSRKPPSVTTPATPRTMRRVTSMPPAEAARASLRLSITSTAPAGHCSTPMRCGWSGFRKTSSLLRSSRAGM